jgi:hypothetical protein
MNMTSSTITELALVSLFLVFLVSTISISIILRARRSEKLRRKFGPAEYARALNEGGSRRHAEARLEARSNRIDHRIRVEDFRR